MKDWTVLLKGEFMDSRLKRSTPGELHVVMRGPEVSFGRGNPGVEESAPLVAHLALGVRITSPDEDNFEFVATLAECERAGIPVSPPPCEFQTSAPGASIVGDMAFFNAGLERAAALAEDMNSHGVFIAEQIRDLVVPGTEIDALPELDDRASYSAQAVRRHIAAALAVAASGESESRLLAAARAVVDAHSQESLTTEHVDALREATANHGGGEAREQAMGRPDFSGGIVDGIVRQRAQETATKLQEVRQRVFVHEVFSLTGLLAALTPDELSAMHEWCVGQVGGAGRVDVMLWPGWKGVSVRRAAKCNSA